jgi:hypothetical protein
MLNILNTHTHTHTHTHTQEPKYMMKIVWMLFMMGTQICKYSQIYQILS